MIEEDKLDNPVWYSLTECHQSYAIANEHIKFYDPEYGPFGGIIKNENISKSIEDYADLVETFFIVGEKPIIPKSIKLNFELVGLQMIITQPVNFNYKDEIIKLGEEHKEDLFGLVKIAYPEYFKKKTFYLGNYYGIYKNKQLVAITGERMQMNSFVEVSAVINHPDHIGKGYAGQLVAYTVNNIFEKHKTPFLHVSASNERAIALYKKLGFFTRRKMSFWNLQK